MKRTILLNPGPVNTSPRVQQALLKGDLCHREEECLQLFKEIFQKLLQAFTPSGGYTAVLLTGSGTAAMESAICSSLSDGKKILVVNNGVYGDRLCRIGRAYGLPLIEMRSSWLELPDLSQMEEYLAKDPEIQVVAMVHHETTTGLINPVERVGELTHSYRRLLLIDSVSGLGGEAIDLDRSHIQFCVGTANKCLQGLPGISFVLIQQEQVKRLLTITPRSLYLSLATYLQNAEFSLPFTPAVQIAYALREALDELLEEGVVQRISRYQQAVDLLRHGFTKMDLRFLIPEPHRSNTITSLFLPKGIAYNTLHDRLREKGYIIYAGQGQLQSEIFRVANMGHLTQEDFRGFLEQLALVLKECR